MSPLVLWLAIGTAFIVTEVLLGFTIVLFFLGISCLGISLVLSLGWIDYGDYYTQISWITVLTICFLSIFWKTLRKLKKRTHRNNFSDIIGSTAIVIKPLTQNSTGKVKWSGSTFRSRLEENSNHINIPKGSSVRIVAIEKNIFIVRLVESN